MKWPAAYYDGKTAQRHPVFARVEGYGLVLESSDGTSVIWPWNEVEQTQGEHPGEPVRLERAGGLGEAVQIADPEVVSALRLHLGERARAAPGSRTQVVVILGSLAATLALGAVLFGRLLPSGSKLLAPLVPLSWEERLGDAALAELVDPDHRCTDTELTGAVQVVLDRLTAALPPSRYTFQSVVADRREVNAFAAPGGRLVVFRGLLEKTNSPDELAGVLAHEVQHVALRHTTAGLLRRLSFQALASLLTGSSETAFAVGAAVSLGGLHFSRQDESEADLEGLKLLRAARGDPAGMVRAFEILRDAGPALPSSLAFLSDHPDTLARIDALRAQVERHSGQARPVPFGSWDWPALAKRCR